MSKKISEVTEAITLENTDVLPLGRPLSNEALKVSVQTLADHVITLIPDDAALEEQDARISSTESAISSLSTTVANLQIIDYTTLRNINIAPLTLGTQVQVAGRTTVGDGGGGIFIWDESDLSSQVAADTLSGIYVAPASDSTGVSGAWVRVVDGTYKPEWYITNTVPGTTDMTAAFVAAIAAAKPVFGTIQIKKTSYYITTTVYFDGVALVGEDGYSSQIHVGGAITALKFTGSRKWIGNFSVWFDDYSTSAAPTTAVGVQFAGNTYAAPTDQFSNSTVEQVYVRYAGRSFTSNSVGTSGMIWNNTFINCRSDYASEYGWYFNSIVGSTTQTWINCMIDGVNVDGSRGYSANSAGWYTHNIDDVVWLNAQADDMQDGKAIYVNLATLVTISGLRSEGAQLINNASQLIYLNAAAVVDNIKLQISTINPGVGNRASVVRFGTLGSGTVGNIMTEALTITSGTFYKVDTNSVQSGRGRVTILGPRIWLADVYRDDVGERTVFANKGPRYGTTAVDPTAGSYEAGDQFWTVAVLAGRPMGRVCLTAGTLGTLSSVTATTTSGDTLVTFNSTSSLKEGDFVSIVGVTGTKRILHIKSSTQAYVSVAADASVVGAAVAYVAPTFAAVAQMGNRSGSATPVSSVTPYFIGEEYLDSTAIRWYKATGLTNTDWSALQKPTTAAAPATTGTISLAMGDKSVITITPTGDCTFNATGGVAGQQLTLVVTTTGTTSRTLTFNTNFITTGTLATGVTSGKRFVLDFITADGTIWIETSRTAGM